MSNQPPQNQPPTPPQTPSKETVVHSAIHNTFLNPGTLFVSALTIAIGFALSPLGAMTGNGVASLQSGNFTPLVLALLGGGIIGFGLLMVFTQQYFALALTTAINNLSVIGIAAILYAVGQFLISFGQSLQPTQPLYGVAVLIAGYALIAVYLILTGQTGAALRESLKPKAPS